MPGLRWLRSGSVTSDSSTVPPSPVTIAPGGGADAGQGAAFPAQVWERRFSGQPSRVQGARRFVAGFLGDDWPDVDTAMLLTSELATNAVLHSRSGMPGGKFIVRVTVRPGDCVQVEVGDDGGPWALRPADGERGRGLEIVAAVASAWGREGSASAGWVVWARLEWPREGADGG